MVCLSLWVKLYARDTKGVMRALPGIKMTKTGSLWIAKSVYDFPTEFGPPGSGPSPVWQIAHRKTEYPDGERYS